eukprot:TRINITY_DN8794_c0_g1_i1.p1 TRINITY_DN8794_c0_g1~~TRINITY_DN8794_c0_g1_i1.p1  ORF type:complete len:140 (+),score=25.35 TRINITY_DN8794_c0_g1_i1:93-512(+)
MDTTTSQAAQKTSDGKATPRQQPARRMQATYEAANNEIAAMRYHGMTTSMSPASRNRVEVPGPGHYNVGKGDEVLCKARAALLAWGNATEREAAWPCGLRDRAENMFGQVPQRQGPACAKLVHTETQAAGDCEDFLLSV